MARKKMISDDIRAQVAARVDAFNQANVRPTKPSGLSRLLLKFGILPPATDTPPVGSYVPHFRGAFLYLDRIGWNKRPFEVCRLKWTGNMEDWEFAIYRHSRYSRNFYNPNELFFPGAGEVDGTVEGAMRAGMMAYPQ